MLVVQILEILQALLRELVVLIIMCSVEDDHRENHAKDGEDEPIQLDDGLRHLFCGDLLLKVNQLLRLRVVATIR